MNLSPIIIFTYNRPTHTKKTIESLAKNKLADKTLLYIFSDGPKNNDAVKEVKEVRKYLNTIKDSKQFLNIKITLSDTNKGLAKSIIDGVTEVFKHHETVIILEDDLLTTSDFIKYMNDSLLFYSNKSNIGCVTGYNPLKNTPLNYNYDTFLIPRNSSLGWGTWKSIWNKIDWEIKDYSNFKTNIKKRKKFNAAGMDRAARLDRQIQKNAQSWSIRFGYNLFKNKLLTVYSTQSKISHIGWDGSGTHTSNNITKFNNTIFEQKKEYQLKDIEINSEIVKSFKKLYGSGIKQEIKEIILIIKNFLN